MSEFELKDFNKRIDLNTNLENISRKICEKYNLGEFLKNEIIKIGYEDFNYILDTKGGRYLVKIYSHKRTTEDVENYLDRIRAVKNSEINAPKPLDADGDIVFRLDYENNHYDISVFEYIDGKNYFELGQKPDEKIIREIAHQTALINGLDFKPKFIYDSWAIINFENEYKKKREYLSEEYQKEFDGLFSEFKNLDFDKLEKGFVHGDIISTNVMIDKSEKIWIIDFAVSNYLPRIIDLAVTACNMCLDNESKEKTLDNISVLLEEYNRYAPLSEYELKVFGIFFKLANAMHILETEFLIKTDGDSEENQYWLNEGKIGWAFYDHEEFLEMTSKIK